MVIAVAKRQSKDFSQKSSASLRLGYVLVGLAIAVAALGGVFSHGVGWVIAAFFCGRV